jgi:hypothetical protein
MIVSTVCAYIYEIKEAKTEGLCSKIYTDETFSLMLCGKNQKEGFAWDGSRGCFSLRGEDMPYRINIQGDQKSLCT